MPRYSVTLPIVGSVTVEVEADDYKAAVDKAMASDISFDDINEWDVLRQRCQGNVCSLPCDSDVAEIEDAD